MAPLKGLHKVRVTLATGRAEYWYAWRGGPKILSERSATDRVLDLKVEAAAAEALRLYDQLMADRKTPVEGLLATLIKAFKASPEFALYAPRTQKDRIRQLAVVEADLGDMPLNALEAKGARKALIDWRNGYKDKPRDADAFASALSVTLAWGRDQGHLVADPMRDWPWIYTVDRAGIVWTAQEIEAVCLEASRPLQLAILFAAYSGIRKADLLHLTWSALAPDHIIRKTHKRGRIIYVPRKPALNQVIAACPETGAVTVLTYNGKPWNSSTFDRYWMEARDKAALKVPSIKGKRFHDLRGSFATLLIRDGADDADVDLVMGWAPGNSEQTRASYVTGEVVAQAALARLHKAAA